MYIMAELNFQFSYTYKYLYIKNFTFVSFHSQEFYNYKFNFKAPLEIYYHYT